MAAKNVEQIFSQLTEKLDEWRTETGVTGTAIGLSYEGKEYTCGSGVTNVNHPLDVTDETLFQIGSITKTYTATAIMLLVEQGKIALDAPVRTYLPDFKVADENVAANATIANLLTHTAGWVGDVFTDTGDNDDALAQYVAQMAELKQLAPPNHTFSYNNAAFDVLGLVIEAVTGQRYEDVIKELIFEPLGLERSFFFPKDVMTHRFAVGHGVGPDGPFVQRPWPIPRSSNPAGAITCHIKDLLTYGEFHLGNGLVGETQLLSPASLAEMHTPHFPIDDKTSVGLSWFVGEIGGEKTIGHGGSTNGQHSQLVLMPAHNFAFAMLTNADPGGQLIKKVEDWMFKTLFDLENTPPQPIEATDELLAQYAGRYTRPSIDVDITVEEGKLIAQLTIRSDFPTEEEAPPPPPITILFCGDDQLIIPDGPFKDIPLEVVRDGDGTIEYLRLGYRVHRRVESS